MAKSAQNRERVKASQVAKKDTAISEKAVASKKPKAVAKKKK